MDNLKIRAFFKASTPNRNGNFMLYMPEIRNNVAKNRILIHSESEDLNLLSFWDNVAGYNDSVILMVYSGLKDFSGNDIYEGDIVEFMIDGKVYTREVKFSNGIFYVELPELDRKRSECSLLEIYDSTDYIIVKGNKYEC